MNISEFAKAAGVSKSAVSRYFNDGYLSDEKRAAIEKAIAETGYAPGTASRSVKTRVTKLIGVILPKLSSDSCARIAEGISSVLGEQGYELLLVNTANDYNKEIKYLDLFRGKRVDGVIFLASVFTPLHRSILSKMHIPVIIVGQRYSGYSCVCHDDFGAAYAVTELLLKGGASCPAYIGVTDEDVAVGAERRRGFMQALSDHGIAVSDEHCACAEFSVDSGYSCARRIFKSRLRPDCLFCATDTIASGAVLYCRGNGIRIPGDILVGSVGDSKIGRVLSLSTAHLHYHTAGREAASMLLSAISHPDAIPRTMQLGFELVERSSTNTSCETL